MNTSSARPKSRATTETRADRLQGHTKFFAQTPHTLLDEHRKGDQGKDIITAFTVAVYTAVQSYNRFGTNSGGHATLEQIAQRAHCSIKQVQRERSRLRDLGYLTWIEGNGIRKRACEYTTYPSADGPGRVDRIGPPDLSDRSPRPIELVSQTYRIGPPDQPMERSREKRSREKSSRGTCEGCGTELTTKDDGSKYCPNPECDYF